MKNRSLWLLLGSFLGMLGMPLQTTGQSIVSDSTALVSVLTIDRNELIGTIVSQNPETLVLKTADYGEVSILKQSIKSITIVQNTQIVNGTYWFENVNTTQYMFLSNAYGLKKGEGYYLNSEGFMNGVNYGFTDNFSLGLTTTPFVVFDFRSPQWLTPKISIPIIKDKLNISTGALLGGIIGGGEGLSSNFGYIYGNVTAGARDRNITVGLGYTYLDNVWASAPTFSFSGMVRTGRKFALISENYFLHIEDVSSTALSFGGRFLSKNMSVDLGLAMVIEEFYTVIPWFNLYVPFGNRPGKK